MGCAFMIMSVDTHPSGFRTHHQECPGRSSRSSSVVRLFVALAHHFATAHSRGAISTAVAPMDVAKADAAAAFVLICARIA